MSIVIEERPGAAFAEPIDEAPFRASSASGYGAELSEPTRRAIPRLEQALVRWLIELLSRKNRQSYNAYDALREAPRLHDFREQFGMFLRAPLSQQSANRSAIVARIRSSADPALYLHEVLRQCSLGGGGPNSFDLAIDLLSQFDNALLEILESFLDFERSRWNQLATAHHVNDDVCYILLRALARSSVGFQIRLDVIAGCLKHGTNSIREAAVHALGDLGGDAAKNLLQTALRQDLDRHVRESAQEALDDMDT